MNPPPESPSTLDPTLPAPPRPRLWAQVGVIVAVVLFPAWLTGVDFSVNGPPTKPESLVHAELYGIVCNLGLIALAAFVISTSGECPTLFGVRRPEVAMDFSRFVFALVCVLVVGEVLGNLAGRFDLYALDHPMESVLPPPPRTPLEYVLVIVNMLLVGFAEEFAYRSVLLTRIAMLTHSPVQGLFWSSLLFGSAHLFYGPGGAVMCGALGLLFGALFLFIGRVWPVALAHGAFDIYVTSF